MVFPGRLNQLHIKKNVTEDVYKATLKLISDKFSKVNSGSLSEVEALDSEVLFTAPQNFFDKYENLVSSLTSEIQTNLSQSNQAMIISQVKNDPTNNDLKSTAFYAINTEFLKQDQNNKNPEYVKLEDIEKKILLALIVNEICGLGPLEPLFKDFNVREIICNGPKDVQVEIEGSVRRVPSCKFKDPQHLQDLITKLYSSVNKDITRTNPMERARLHDNSRVFAVHESVAPTGPSLNIRRHTDDWISPDQLIEFGTMDEELYEWIGGLLNAGVNMLISGGTSTGKSLSLNTPIPTTDGWKLLKDITTKDKIFSPTGITDVLGVYDNPKRKVYRIDFETKQSLYADAEHNWKVKNNKTNEIETKTTIELLNGILYNNQSYSVPSLTIPVEYNLEYDVDSLPIHPYLLGILFSNLNYSTEYNQNKLEDIISVLKILSPDTIIDNTYNSVLFKNSDNKELSLDNSFKKEMIEFSDENTRLFFIKGIIDSQPFTSYKNGYWKVRITNKEEADFLVRVISSLGMKCKLSKWKEKQNNHWIINIYTLNLLSETKLETKLFKDKNYLLPAEILLFDKITKISSTNRYENMRCLQVSDPSKTFLVGNDYNITHNTTLLGALTGFYRNDARILTVERNIELKGAPNKLWGTPMEVVPPKPGGLSAGVSMRDLVEATTQQRPDGIIVGETTGSEAWDLVQSLNTGHFGASTIHANSCQDAIYRLMSLISQADLIKGQAAYDLIASAFDIVIQINRFPQDGSRKIIEISEVGTECKKASNGVIYLPTTPIWIYKANEMTSSSDTVSGRWVKVGELSQERKEKHNLHFIKLKNRDELRELYTVK